MKHIIAAVLLLLVCAYTTQAQGREKELGASASASQVYLEAGGIGLLYSINYDQRVQKQEDGLGFRFGIGGLTGYSNGYFCVPVQLNYLYGNGGRYLEFGGGVSYLYTENFRFNNNLDKSSILYTATIGFRKVPFGRKGLTWRVAFTPFIGSGTDFTPSFGVSLGYRF